MAARPRMSVIALGIVVTLLALAAIATLVGTRMIERAHPPAGRFVEVSGGRLHIVDLDRRPQPAGDAPPLLLIHGASGNLEDMRLALGEQLSARYRVILVDRPGHGWSDRSVEPDAASPAHQAAMLSEMLDRLGIDRAIVVAHSWAGTVATTLALDHPDKVAGLVLLAPVSHPWPGGIAWYYHVAAAPLFGPLFAYTLALPLGELLLRATVAVVFAPQTAPADYVARTGVELMLRPRNFLANARDVAGIRAFVTRQAPRYPAIQAPTIIIAGNRDTIVSSRIHAQALTAALPHAKFVLLEGVGHMVHYAAADRVVTAIDEVSAQAAAR
jgi:pimeloyl-ACP methyl ester carboxylesterase